MALDETTALCESKVGKQLKKFLKKNVVDAGLTEELAVIDKSLGGAIKEKLGTFSRAFEGLCFAFRKFREYERGTHAAVGEAEKLPMQS